MSGTTDIYSTQYSAPLQTQPQVRTRSTVYCSDTDAQFCYESEFTHKLRVSQGVTLCPHLLSR